MSTNKYQVFTWVTFPNFVRKRISRFLGDALIDGLYLNGIFKQNFIMLPFLFLMGLGIGSSHLFFNTDEVYSASLVTIGIMLILGSWSAAWGFWIWLGYSIGDMFMFERDFLERSNVFLFYIAKIIPLILLFILLINFPLLCKTLRLKILSKIKFISDKGKGVHIIVYSLCYGAMIYAWAQGVPTLIRPVYTWQYYNYVPIPVIATLQNQGRIIAILGLILGIVRMLAEYTVLKNGKIIAIQNSLIKSYQVRPIPLIHNKLIHQKWVRYLLFSFLFTFIVSGLFSSWIDCIIFLISLLAILFIRDQLLIRTNFWTNTISKIPLLLRFVIAIAITIFVSYYLIQYFWDQGGDSFTPVYYSILFSLLIQFIFIPKIKMK